MSLIYFSYPKQLQKCSLTFLALFFGALFFCTQSFAQTTQPKPTPTPAAAQDDDVVRVNVNLVQIEAIVKDKKGKPVTDLQASDFEIVENGRAHPLNFFSFIPLTEKRESVAATDNRLARNEVRRTIVFMMANPLIDVGISVAGRGGAYAGSFTLRPRAFNAANNANEFLNKFINEQIGERDLVSIISTDADLGLLTSFTNDRNLLRASIKQMTDNLGSSKQPVIRLMISNDGIGLKPLIQQNLGVIKMAESAIEQLQKVPGRKIIVIMARGLLYRDNQVRDALESLVEKANKAQVTFYALHLSGLEGAGAGIEGLKFLAENTGGRAVYNTNDVSIGFGEILQENNGYYLLAYDPGQENLPQPHQITVRVKRPDLRVQTRSTAYKTELNDKQLSSDESLLSILRSSFATSDIKIALSSTFESETKTQGRIKTVLNILSTDLEPELQTDGMRHIKLDLAIQITGPDYSLVRQEIKHFTLKLNNDEWNNIVNNGLTYQFDTDITQAGYYQVNAAVRVVNSERVGSVSRFINCKMQKPARQ